MVNLEETGKFISKCRREKRLTQKELGERLNVTDRAVSKWETGRGFPDVNIMEDLCRELDINVSELLAGRRIEPERYQEETEKMLAATVSSGQLYGLQIILYILEFAAITVLFIPFIVEQETFLPPLKSGNVLCWICGAVILISIIIMDKQIPGREFRMSNAWIEGIAGGVYFLLLMAINFVNAGGIEGMNDGTGLAEKLTVLLIFLVCFVITIAVRVKRARDRRRELEE